MPKDNDEPATFDLDDMRSAVRRMSLIADERNRSIRLTVREGEVEITAQSSEQGEGNESRPGRLQRRRDYARIQLAVPARIPQQCRLSWRVRRSEVSGSRVKLQNSADSALPLSPHPPQKKPAHSIAFEFNDSNAQTQMSIARRNDLRLQIHRHAAEDMITFHRFDGH